MIGYNRTVKLRWLDETVDMVLAGMPDSDIYSSLKERLEGELSIGSSAVRGSREKTITLLMKTWVRVPDDLRELRQDAFELMKGIRRQERLPLHWGMTMAVYPFWRVVAEVTGRLFRLQGSAAPRQVQRRVKELMGEREVVARSARYVLRAFADWGVVADSERQGEYQCSPARLITDPELAKWLYEAVVVSLPDGASDFRSLVSSPGLFPFQLPAMSPAQLSGANRVEVIRHSLEESMVKLKPRVQVDATDGSRTTKGLGFKAAAGHGSPCQS